MSLPSAPRYCRVTSSIAQSAPITLGTPVSGTVPANWTVSWVGTSVMDQTPVVQWNNVCALMQSAGTMQGQLTNGEGVVSSDQVMADSEVTLVCADAGGGKSNLSLYIDSGLDASATVNTPTSGQNAGPVIVNQSHVDSVRIFNAAMDPTTTDLFWFDDPGKPSPAALVAAYDLFTVPPMDRLAGAPIAGTIDQTMIAGGRIWNGTTGDLASSNNFQPGVGGGFTIQAWAFLTPNSAANFVIATVMGSNGFTFSYTSAGVLQVQVNGKIYAATQQPLPGCWSNIAAVAWVGGVQIFINGESVLNSTDPVDVFVNPQTRFGGWTAVPGAGSVATALQSITFFKGALSAGDLKGYMYARPLSDSRCMGMFRGLRTVAPFNLVTGDNVTASPKAGYQAFWGPTTQYQFPASDAAIARTPRRPLGLPGEAQAGAFIAETLCGLALGAEAPRMIERIRADIRVTPEGELVLVGQVMSRIDGDLVRLDLVTADGLVEFSGLSLPADQACAWWVTKLLTTLMLGFTAMLGHFGFSSPSRSAWVENFLENNENAVALTIWIEGMLNRPLTTDDIIKGLKILWSAGTFSWSLWDLLDGEDYYDTERAALSMMSIGAAFVGSEQPSTSRWWAKVILQLGSTMANVAALLKTRPAGCPTSGCANGAPSGPSSSASV